MTARSIWLGFQAIYSALYNWNIARWKGDDYMASFMTAAGLAGAMTMNVILVIGIIAAVIGPLGSIGRVAAIVVPLGFLLLNYLAFVHDTRYVGIVKRFQRRPISEQRRFTWFAWLYIVGSFATVGTFIFTMALHTQG